MSNDEAKFSQQATALYAHDKIEAGFGSARPSRRSKPNMSLLVDQQRYHSYSGELAGAYTHSGSISGSSGGAAPAGKMRKSAASVRVPKTPPRDDPRSDPDFQFTKAELEEAALTDSSLSSIDSGSDESSDEDRSPSPQLKTKTQSDASNVKRAKLDAGRSLPALPSVPHQSSELEKLPTPLGQLPRIPKKPKPELKRSAATQDAKQASNKSSKKSRVLMASDSELSEDSASDLDAPAAESESQEKPLSAYAEFFKERLPEIRRKLPSAGFKQVSRIMSDMWDGLSVAETSVYKQLSDKNNKAFLARQSQSSASGKATKRPAPAPLDAGEAADAPAAKLKKKKPRAVSAVEDLAAPSRCTATAASRRPSLLCQREGCTQLAIEDPGWKRQFCSTQCCVRAVKATFQTFVREQLSVKAAADAGVKLSAGPS